MNVLKILRFRKPVDIVQNFLFLLVFFPQQCNSAQKKHTEEEDNNLRERYREKSAEVRKLQSKIMVS